MTQTLIIHGSRASKLAHVSSADTDFRTIHWGESCVIESGVLLTTYTVFRPHVRKDRLSEQRFALLCSLCCINARNLTEAPATTSLSAVSSGNACRKCGAIKKSGKLSCCARGGAWFKNCGDVGDTKFGHTWAEGVQACKDSVNSISTKPPLQVMIRHAEVMSQPSNISQPRNSIQQQTNAGRDGGGSNGGTTDSGDYLGLTKVAVCFCVIFIISPFQS